MITVLLSLLAVLTLLLPAEGAAYDGLCRTVEDVRNLPPRHWCEVPGSELRGAEKKPSEYEDWDGTSSAAYDSFQRVMGVSAVTRTWNSATFDTNRNCLLVTGGGHNDYGGNEVYRFCLDSLSWDRLTDPTPFPNRHPEYQNADGSPVSRHTYGGVVYVPGIDRLFLFDGSPDDGPGTCGVRGTWTLDLASREAAGEYLTSQWELRTAEGEPEPGCNNVAVFDPSAARIVYKNLRGTYEFDFGSAKWVELSGDARLNNAVNLAIDPAKQLLVEVGGGETALWDITKDLSGGVIATSGVKTIEQGDDPGLVYDPRIGKIVGWEGGTSVFVLDTGTRVWSEVGPASTNTVDPGPVSTAGGVFGRFAYSAESNVYMYVDRVSENVYLYRLTNDEAPRAPKPPADLGTTD
ncbi:hypothetical protein [Lentisalinibacter salinarum]|uniref:hypothetical protein n=1 Tax=Lentisalinibacter salinarum TaxID=2992239 RepID=UPI00387019A2